MQDNGKGKSSFGSGRQSAEEIFGQRGGDRINTTAGRFDPEAQRRAIEERRRKERELLELEERVRREERERKERERARREEEERKASKKRGKGKKASSKKSKRNKNNGKSKDDLRREHAEKTRRKRKRKIIEWFVFTALIFIAIFIVASLTVLFRIETIKVEGDTRYTAEQIIEASQVKTGDNLWRTMTKKVSSEVSATLPYIGKVKLVRKIPSTLIMVVEETTPKYAVKNGKRYALVDKNDKLLEAKAKKSGKALVIEGLKLSDAQEGMPLSPEVPEAYKTAKEIASHAAENKIKLVRVNVSDLNAIYAVTDSRLKLELGSATELNEKMKMAHEVILKLLEDGKINEGTINIKSTTKAFYREGPIDPETTKPDTPPDTDVTDNSGTADTTDTTGTQADVTDVPESTEPAAAQ